MVLSLLSGILGFGTYYNQALSFLLTVTISSVTFNIKSGSYTTMITELLNNELIKSFSTLIRLLKSHLCQGLKGP